MSYPRGPEEPGEHHGQSSVPHRSAWSDGNYGVAQPLDASGPTDPKLADPDGSQHHRGAPEPQPHHEPPASKFRGVLSKSPRMRGPKLAWALFIFGILLAVLSSAVIAPWVRQIEDSAPVNGTVSITTESATDLWIWTTDMSEDADQCGAESVGDETVEAQRAALGVETRHSHDDTTYPMTATHVVPVGAGSWTVGCTDEAQDGTSWGEVFAVSYPVSMGWQRFADYAMNIGATAIGVALVVFVVSSATSARRRTQEDADS